MYLDLALVCHFVMQVVLIMSLDAIHGRQRTFLQKDESREVSIVFNESKTHHSLRTGHDMHVDGSHHIPRLQHSVGRLTSCIPLHESRPSTCCPPLGQVDI